MRNLNIGLVTRPQYDIEAYDTNMLQATEPIRYSLYKDQYDHSRKCNQVFTNNGTLRSTTTTKMSSVPYETLLTGRSGKLDIEGRFAISDYKEGDIKEKKIGSCSVPFDQVSTHITHPKPEMDELNINRFHYTHRNPQNHIYWNTEANTRLETRDNHKPVQYRQMQYHDIQAKRPVNPHAHVIAKMLPSMVENIR